jgi:uncharacterized membrane protein YqjE
VESSVGTDLGGRASGARAPAPPPDAGAADDDQDDTDSSDPGPRRPASRIGRVAVSLLQVHAQIARQELARDQGRLLRGVIFVLIGSLLLATVIVLLQVIGVTLLTARGLSLWAAVLVMAAGDAGLGGLLLLLGARALQQPVMPETRSLLRRTLGALTAP